MKDIPWWLTNEEIAKQPKWRRKGLKILQESFDYMLDEDDVERHLKPGERLCDNCEGCGYLYPSADGSKNPCSVCNQTGKIVSTI